MANNIKANTAIVVTWLEPQRDRGRTSTVKAKQVIKPNRKKLTTGIIAFVRWRSTGRIYKAIVKSIEGFAPTSPNDDFSDDDAPIATMVNILPRQGNNLLGKEPDSTIESVARNEEDSDIPTTSTIEKKLDSPPRKHPSSAATSTPINTQAHPNCHQSSSSSADFMAAFTELRKHFDDTANRIDSEMRSFREEMRREQRIFQDSVHNQFSILASTLAKQTEEMSSLRNLIERRITRKEEGRTASAQQNAPTPEIASKRISPGYGCLNGQNVILKVDDELEVAIDKHIYEDYFSLSQTATSFARKLVPHLFSQEEMLRGNCDGGKVTTSEGVVIKDKLDGKKVKSIMRQTEWEFNGATKTHQGYNSIKRAINDRCRCEKRKM